MKTNMKAAGERKYSLKRNIVWTLAGNVVYAVTQWGLIVLLAWVSDPAIVGRFSLALAYVMPILLFSQFQLRALQAADTNGDYRFSQYLGVRIVFTAAAVAVVPLVAWALGSDGGIVAVSFVLAVARGFESIGDIAHGALQMRERFHIVSYSKVSKGLLAFAAFAAGMYAFREATPDERLLGAAACMALAYAVLLVYDLLQVKHDEPIRPSFDPQVIFRIVRWSAPLGGVLMLSSLAAYVPRVQIGHALGESELGIYSALGYLLMAGTIVTNAMGQAVAPRMGRLYHGGQIAALWRLIMSMNAAGAVIGVVGLAIAAVAGQPLLTLLYTSDYGAYSDVLLLLLVSGAIDFVATFYGYALTAIRQVKVQLGQSIAWTICSIGATAVLLPSFGLQGAACAMIIASAVRALLQLLTLRRKLRT